MTNRPHLRPEPRLGAASARERCRAFLADRATEELARLWERDTAVPSGGAGLAAQVTVLDDVLTALALGDLPARAELRILLFAYGRHHDYDPRWTDLAT